MNLTSAIPFQPPPPGIKLNYFGSADTANIKSEDDSFNGWMIFQVLGNSSDVTFNFNATNFKFGVEDQNQNNALLTLDMGKTQEGLSEVNATGRTTYNLSFSGNSAIYANIRNNDNLDPAWPVRASGNDTNITLEGEAKWFGDLYISHTGTIDDKLEQVENDTQNKVVLNGSSAWTGNVRNEGKGTNEVVVSDNSSWTITQYSMVNKLTSTSTVSIENNAGLGFFAKLDDGEKSSLKNLTFGEGSYIQMMEGADVEITKAEGVAKVYYESLDNKLNIATADDGVALIVDGSLNTTGDTVAKLQEAYTGAKADFTIGQGLITDGSTGTIEGDKVTVTGTTRNTNLVNIADTTAITMMLWRAEADDLNQRMGDLRDSTANNGLWVRTHGGKMEATSVDNEFVGFQFGYDHNVSEGAQKQFVGGAISYTSGDATFANGSGDNYALGITGYSTWLFESGSYLDVSAKYGTLNNKFDINAGDLGKLSGDYSTHGLAFNVETGHRFPVANLFYVEPQLAFTASHIFGEDYGVGQGVSLSQDSFDSYVARAGIAAGIKCPDNMGSVWMKASYLYDFDGETSTTAKNGTVSNKFDQDFGGSWYELGIGATVNFTKNLHGYADFEYAAGAEIETPYKWNVGARYVW